MSSESKVGVLRGDVAADPGTKAVFKVFGYQFLSFAERHGAVPAAGDLSAITRYLSSGFRPNRAHFVHDNLYCLAFAAARWAL